MRINSLKLIAAVSLILTFAANEFVYPQFTKASHFNESLQRISSFIASEEFIELSSQNSSFDVIDSLYLYSLKQCNGDVSETLLVLAFATLPYNVIPIRIPIIGLKLKVPLPSPTNEVFEKKLANLPTGIFYSSKGGFGDKDKLAHFFGTAFLSYSIRIFNLSKFMSIFVELFESAFNVEGAIDYRDLQADSLGEIFGNYLTEKSDALPSSILGMYYLFLINY